MPKSRTNSSRCDRILVLLDLRAEAQSLVKWADTMPAVRSMDRFHDHAGNFERRVLPNADHLSAVDLAKSLRYLRGILKAHRVLTGEHDA